MWTVTSADGTQIAYQREGFGPAVVLVGGGLDDGSENAVLVPALADEFTVFNYARRGRGGSGDPRPYTVRRELEDLAAVLDAAGGPRRRRASLGPPRQHPSGDDGAYPVHLRPVHACAPGRVLRGRSGCGGSCAAARCEAHDRRTRPRGRCGCCRLAGTGVLRRLGSQPNSVICVVRHPPRPRAFRERRNTVQNRRPRSLRPPTREPRTGPQHGRRWRSQVEEG